MDEFQDDPATIPFAQSGFDRHSLYRDRVRYFADCLRDGSAMVVLVHDRKVALNRRETGFDATLVDASMFRRDQLDTLSGVFLGTYLGRPAFSLSCDDHPRRLLTLESPPLQFFDLRQASALLNAHAASLLGYALAMDYWHRTHRYCGLCGNPTESSETGHLRTCINRDCGRKHFPRTDPAIIVLIEDGRDSCLLGRKREWPDRRYSTIAGFVEPGETPEQAVSREVYEETGTTVRDITYTESQPWPFPGSLMLGYSAIAQRGAIRLLDNELQDARWFTRDEILRWVPDGRLLLPPRISIAYRLIENWFHRGNPPPLGSLDAGSCGSGKP